jgi:hypothetical protein
VTPSQCQDLTALPRDVAAPAGGGWVKFEAAPMKLTRELLEVMDSDSEGTPSELFDYFKVGVGPCARAGGGGGTCRDIWTHGACTAEGVVC